MRPLLGTFLRLLGLVVVLNLVRYLVGGPLEAVTIMEPMHAVMPRYPEVFDLDFTRRDFAVSLAYIFTLVALANGLLYRFFFPPSASRTTAGGTSGPFPA